MKRYRKLANYNYRLALQNQPLIQDVFNKWINEELKKINKAEDFNFNYQSLSKALKGAFNQLYRNTINKASNWLNNTFNYKLTEEQIPIVRNKSMEDYNDKFASDKVKGVTNFTKTRINSIIKVGQAEGMNVREISEEIDKYIKNPSRSLTIARTETSNAVNNTNFNSATEAGLKYKTWWHTGAGKTSRKNHQAISGTKVRIGTKFNLGKGIKADYPHDPSLPPSEVINCYCIVTFS